MPRSRVFLRASWLRNNGYGVIRVVSGANCAYEALQRAYSGTLPAQAFSLAVLFKLETPRLGTLLARSLPLNIVRYSLYIFFGLSASIFS